MKWSSEINSRSLMSYALLKATYRALDLQQWSKQKNSLLEQRAKGIGGMRCEYCGKYVSPSAPFGSSNKATLDHATPLSRGGKTELENTRISCNRCNTDKKSMTEDEFRECVVTTKAKRLENQKKRNLRRLKALRRSATRMNVQQFLLANPENGLKRLAEEFFIEVKDYPDRVVLNYSQIDSPRFHPVVNECRGLILQKGTWLVMARSFNRFFNYGEGDGWKDFPFEQSRIETKLDGSLMTLYFDGQNWCVSSRSMAFAEGQTTFGRIFSEVFWDAAAKTELRAYMAGVSPVMGDSFVFELTGPENRVVSPYSENEITLIGGRKAGHDEFTCDELDKLAKVMEISRPDTFSFSSIDEMIAYVNSQPWKVEGCVLVAENENGSHRRLKVKNAAYLGVAHMRNNGVLSARRVLEMVMNGEWEEYLSYFDSDRPFVETVLRAYEEALSKLSTAWEKLRTIEDRKTFALSVFEHVGKGPESGVLFSMKDGKFATVKDGLKNCDSKKLVACWNIKDKILSAQ